MSRIGKSLIAILLVLAGLVAGLWLGGHPETLPGFLRNAFVNEDRALRAEVVDKIYDSYYEEVDPAKLEDASVRGIVRSLGDRFSHYFSPRETVQFEESLTGEFDGVGMSVEEGKRGLAVIDVFEGSPADRAGIRQGDVVVEVDGESIAGDPADVATAKIKGEPGTSVELTVRNPDSRHDRTLELERERIDVPVVESKLRERDGEKVGVIELLTFTQGAHGLVKREAQKLLDRGAESLVLDVRGNGGGLLQEAILVASAFVEDGEIVTTRGRAKPERVFNAQGQAIPEDIPMVVLVDGGSASASEIVAGAVRDHGRATVVGERTFGKGVFQEVQPLSNGGALDLTVGSYFLPDGENISDRGIEPEVKAVDKPRTERDEALPTALDELAEPSR